MSCARRSPSTPTPVDHRPGNYVGSSPLADVSCLPELPTLIRLKYRTEMNRWTHHPVSGWPDCTASAAATSPGHSCWIKCCAAATSSMSRRWRSSTDSDAGHSSICGAITRPVRASRTPHRIGSSGGRNLVVGRQPIRWRRRFVRCARRVASPAVGRRSGSRVPRTALALPAGF